MDTIVKTQTVGPQAMVEAVCREAREAAHILATTSPDRINQALARLVELLEANQSAIVEQNELDINNAQNNGKNVAFVDRLTLNAARVQGMSQAVREIIALKARTGMILEERQLENGVLLQRRAVPLGVIGIIYESRPNVTVDAAALCLKSNNAVVLKGGSEAYHSNRFLSGLIRQALEETGLPASVVGFVDSTERAATLHLLRQDRYLDVLIPRGGYELVRSVVANSSIPVLYHAEGGARVYVDASADLAMAAEIVFNSKTSRPSTCNTLDTVVLHRAIASDFLRLALPRLLEAGVEVRAEAAALELTDGMQLADETDWTTEYLDLRMSVRLVDSPAQALDFIRQYSKRHTEGLVATDPEVINGFINEVDAAALMINCSTRLHDGGEFGLGAEMGISTGKLHARGPVGLDELSTYKWIAQGDGQLRK